MENDYDLEEENACMEQAEQLTKTGRNQFMHYCYLPKDHTEPHQCGVNPKACDITWPQGVTFIPVRKESD